MSSDEPRPSYDKPSEPGVTREGTRFVGSIQMYTMHEALAREHMRQREQEARRHRLAYQMAAANRWRYLERRAHAAYQRHAHRAEQSAQASALAE